MSYQRIFITTVLLILVQVTGANAEEAKMWTEKNVESKGRLLSYEMGVAEAEIIQLLQDSKELKKHPKGAYYGIKFLGQIRSKKAVPVLCDRLLYEQTVKRYRSFVWHDRYFPAMKALTEIGLPSVHGLLKYIAQHDVESMKSEGHSVYPIFTYTQIAANVIVAVVKLKDVEQTIDQYIKKIPHDKKKQIQRLEKFKKAFKIKYAEQLKAK